MKVKHVAVLMGGFSSERPVSLSSGNACADALESGGLPGHAGRRRARCRRGARRAQAGRRLQCPARPVSARTAPSRACSNISAIPYTHSGVLASALAMNKEQAKTDRARRPAFRSPSQGARPLRHRQSEHPMAPPYVVKPVNEGSSFGVVIVKEDQSHPPQVISSPDWKYGDTVMVERYIARPRADLRGDGRRGAGCHRDHPDRPCLLRLRLRNMSPGGSKHECPAKISPNIYQKIQTLALKAHQAIGCRGVSRSDFRYDDRHRRMANSSGSRSTPSQA